MDVTEGSTWLWNSERVGCDNPDGVFSMNDQELHNQFSELLARHQSEIYAYIFAIVRNWEDANDLFQCVCLVLWSKFACFQQGSSFFAWARQIAQFEVRKFLTRKQLPRYVGEDLLENFSKTNNAAQRSGVELGLAALAPLQD